VCFDLGAARKKAYEAAGIGGYLQKRLDQMKEAARPPGRVPALDLAEMYTLLGEKDQALQCGFAPLVRA
jgi:hypothetical protein